jgi:hypothetical protein
MDVVTCTSGLRHQCGQPARWRATRRSWFRPQSQDQLVRHAGPRRALACVTLQRAGAYLVSARLRATQISARLRATQSVQSGLRFPLHVREFRIVRRVLVFFRGVDGIRRPTRIAAQRIVELRQFQRRRAIDPIRAILQGAGKLQHRVASAAHGNPGARDANEIGRAELIICRQASQTL